MSKVHVYLKPMEKYRLMDWMANNLQLVRDSTDDATARAAQEALSIPAINRSHVRNARFEFGIHKHVTPRPRPAARASSHVEYTDEETQVRISALAHAMLTLFKILGEDNRPCARRIAELFPEIGGVA